MKRMRLSLQLLVLAILLFQSSYGRERNNAHGSLGRKLLRERARSNLGEARFATTLLINKLQGLQSQFQNSQNSQNTEPLVEVIPADDDDTSSEPYFEEEYEPYSSEEDEDPYYQVDGEDPYDEGSYYEEDEDVDEDDPYYLESDASDSDDSSRTPPPPPPPPPPPTVKPKLYAYDEYDDPSYSDVSEEVGNDEYEDEDDDMDDNGNIYVNVGNADKKQVKENADRALIVKHNFQNNRQIDDVSEYNDPTPLGESARSRLTSWQRNQLRRRRQRQRIQRNKNRRLRMKRYRARRRYAARRQRRNRIKKRKINRRRRINFRRRWNAQRHMRAQRRRRRNKIKRANNAKIFERIRQRSGNKIVIHQVK